MKVRSTKSKTSVRVPKKTINSNEYYLLKSKNTRRLRRGQFQIPRNARRNISLPIQQGSQLTYVTPKQELTKGVMRVSHREPLGPINGGIDFFTQGFILNPGNSVTFPWLSAIAAGYESYRFEKLKFIFLTSSSSTYVGEIVMAPNYNASANPPVNTTTMEQLQGFVRSLVWKDISCTLNRSDLNLVGPKRYVRVSDLGPNRDIKLYDAGTFYVATQGQINNNQIGSLYVEYDVQLFVPRSNLLLMRSGTFENFTETGWTATVTPWFGPNPESQPTFGPIIFRPTNEDATMQIVNLEVGKRYHVSIYLRVDDFAGSVTVEFSPELGHSELSESEAGSGLDSGFTHTGVLEPIDTFGNFKFVASPVPAGTVYRSTVVNILELAAGALS